jgi:hypothetical protein
MQSLDGGVQGFGFAPDSGEQERHLACTPSGWRLTNFLSAGSVVALRGQVTKTGAERLPNCWAPRVVGGGGAVDTFSAVRCLVRAHLQLQVCCCPLALWSDGCAVDQTAPRSSLSSNLAVAIGEDVQPAPSNALLAPASCKAWSARHTAPPLPDCETAPSIGIK